MQRRRSSTDPSIAPRSLIAQVALLIAGTAACTPALQGPVATQCAPVDSADALKLALADFTTPPFPESLVGRALSESLGRKYGVIRVEVLEFERDRLGAVLDIGRGFALGGDNAYRVTGCGCAQVIQPGEDTAQARASRDLTSARWHNRFLPPDSALAVELARDAMVDADRFSDSLGRLVDSVLYDATDNDVSWDMVALRRINEKYILYDVVGFSPDPAGVMITLAPRRRGWSGGGRVRVTGLGCLGYRWTGV